MTAMVAIPLWLLAVLVLLAALVLLVIHGVLTVVVMEAFRDD